MSITRILAVAALLTASLAAQARPCSFETVRPTCGPLLSGRDRVDNTTRLPTHVITFSLSNAPANAMGVFAFGSNQVSIPFPGTPCVLHLLPSVIIPFNTNRLGEAQRSATVNGNLNLVLMFQSAHATATSLDLSNGLKMTCR